MLLLRRVVLKQLALKPNRVALSLILALRRGALYQCPAYSVQRSYSVEPKLRLILSSLSIYISQEERRAKSSGSDVHSLIGGGGRRRRTSGRDQWQAALSSCSLLSFPSRRAATQNRFSSLFSLFSLFLFYLLFIFRTFEISHEEPITWRGGQHEDIYFRCGDRALPLRRQKTHRSKTKQNAKRKLKQCPAVSWRTVGPVHSLQR